MTDEDPARRYEVLRQAARAVLEASAAAADAAPPYPAHQRNLEALARVLEGAGPQRAEVREIQDPDMHMLSRRDYERGMPNGAPYSFGAEAESIRRSMALDDAAEHPVRHWPQEYPTLTELKAMTVATLLQELAARLRATGDAGGARLAEVALELAEDLLTPTFAGAQRPGAAR